MATFKRLGNYRVKGNASATVKYFPEAATQSFKRGDLVTLSSGKVAVAVAYTSGDPVASGTKILGIADKDASGTTDTSIPVIIADDKTEFLLPVFHPTAGSAVTAVTNVGVAYELYRATVSGNLGFGVDISETTDTKVIPTEIDPTYPAGEQYGWFWCRVMQAQRALG